MRQMIANIKPPTFNGTSSTVTDRCTVVILDFITPSYGLTTKNYVRLLL